MTSVHSLAKQWRDGSLHDDIQKELDPILDQAIDLPEALAPRYATSLPTQVTFMINGRVQNSDVFPYKCTLWYLLLVYRYSLGSYQSVL